MFANLFSKNQYIIGCIFFTRSWKGERTCEQYVNAKQKFFDVGLCQEKGNKS